MSREIIVVGAHAAGVDAASAARKTDRRANITLITKEKYAGYSRCGIPFVLAGHIPSFKDLIVFPRSYYRMMKLNLKTESTVTNIDPNTKTVERLDKNGNSEILHFTSLILTTGASPFVPPIKGREKNGVFLIRTIEDGEKIRQAMQTGKSAVIIGAGLIGLEIAAAFVEKGIKTTVVELLPQILPGMLDEDMAKIVQENLEGKGIRIITGQGVNEILGTEKASGVSVAEEQINADFIVVATGVRANTELAQKAGITLGETRAIKVNMRMETSIEDIYAAGDCVESINLITKRPTISQLGTTAVRQARVAGTNAAGGYATFPGVLGSAVTKLFDLEIGVTGLTEKAAANVGIETVAGKITSKTRADYYPGALPIRIKIVVERETEKIIGGQIVGGEEVAQRVNALSFAIQKGMTVRELAKADTCYAPPLAETWEPMVLAAQTALRKLR